MLFSIKSNCVTTRDNTARNPQANGGILHLYEMVTQLLLTGNYVLLFVNNLKSVQDATSK